MRITCDKATKLPAKIVMRTPFDGHQHLRQGAMLKLVAPMVAKRFFAAIVMPNTIPPITTVEQFETYTKEVRSSVPTDGFWPLMTMYLTDNLRAVDVASLAELGILYGVKYYPRGLTTNSDSGVEEPASLWTKGTNAYDVLRTLEEFGCPLLLHAADGFASRPWQPASGSYMTGERLDPYDQEEHFVNYTLPEICGAHPGLKISVEHLSTGHGVAFMREYGNERLGCSLTAQHLLLDRRDSFDGGFRPQRFWWPIIQPKEHRDELRRFASEGHSFVWLGSDSAPHPIGKKLADCCTGGVLMAHAGIEFYVEAFEDMGCLDKLEDFASVNGPRFYGLEPSKGEITLVRENWKITEAFYALDVSGESGGSDKVVPFRLGERVRWKLAS